jgi:hypothetical protein
LGGSLPELDVEELVDVLLEVDEEVLDVVVLEELAPPPPPKPVLLLAVVVLLLPTCVVLAPVEDEWVVVELPPVDEPPLPHAVNPDPTERTVAPKATRRGLFISSELLPER